VATKRSNQIRIDLLLVEQGLVESRAKAQALIMAGSVYVGTQRVDKPATLVPKNCEVELKGQQKFVSRGGLKLEGALQELQVTANDLICVDVGASTGGFTDCLLQYGARKVYAVDVGQGLLAHKLRVDSRVVVMDRTNARHLRAENFDLEIDLVVVDASFIGMTQLAEALVSIVRPEGHVLAMIKPQFEVGREAARASDGVIKDQALRARAIESATSELTKVGLTILRGCDSKTPGPKGNVEHFVLAARSL
jgi:23S rRNA (cytidine1920-2'-O)/16S rRNA (cytidine1409-2'-O)-methyltransferase